MSSVVELSPGGPVRVYTTGGSDFVLALSTHVIRLKSGAISREVLDAAAADALVSDVIVAMARKSLRTLGLAYRDFDSIGALPGGWQESPSGLEDELTFYGVLGIKDPLREVSFCGVTLFYAYVLFNGLYLCFLTC